MILSSSLYEKIYKVLLKELLKLFKYLASNDIHTIFGWLDFLFKVTEQICEITKNIEIRDKIISTSPILRLNHKLISIMMNKGGIHKDLGQLFRFSSNAIKSYDEMS